MYDYPVPENEADYKEAVKIVKYVLSLRNHEPKSHNDELKQLQANIQELQRVLRPNDKDE